MTDDDTSTANRLRIPRKYALQVAPVALICILLAMFKQSLYPILCALLSVWFWLQWPRRKMSYWVFLLAVVLLCIAPGVHTLHKSIADGTNLGFRLGDELCDCWIALLISTTLAIATRMAISWRFVDRQLEEASKQTSLNTAARGSLFDLIAAVTAFAVVFALVRYRLEGEFGYGAPHVVLPMIMSVLSTLAAVVFIRLFAPLGIALQVIVLLFALPLVGCTVWIALQAVAPMTGIQRAAETYAAAIAISAAVFATVTSLCGLRLHGFEVRKFGPKGIRYIVVAACVLATACAFVGINTHCSYGPTVGESPSLLGWPFTHSHMVLEKSGRYSFSTRDFRVRDHAGFAIDIAVGIGCVFVFGIGIATVACNLFSRSSKPVASSPAASRPLVSRLGRSSFWLAAMTATAVALVAFSYFNLHALNVESRFEERPYADQVHIRRTKYAIHPIDRITASVYRLLGKSVSENVIFHVNTQALTDVDHIREICQLPELKDLTLPAEMNELPLDCVDSLANRNRLYSLSIGKTPLSGPAADKITQIQSLQSLAVESPLPDYGMSFGSQLNELAIDLRQCSQAVHFPGSLATLVLLISDKTDLSGFEGTYAIDDLVLDCSARTSPIELRARYLERFTLVHGDQDISLNLSPDIGAIDFVASRSPVLSPNGGREPNISVSVAGGGARFGRPSFQFLDSSCNIIDLNQMTPWKAKLELRSTKESSLADQLDAISSQSDLRTHVSRKSGWPRSQTPVRVCEFGRSALESYRITRRTSL